LRFDLGDVFLGAGGEDRIVIGRRATSNITSRIAQFGISENGNVYVAVRQPNAAAGIASKKRAGPFLVPPAKAIEEDK
jgi:hypothetical protein